MVEGDAARDRDEGRRDRRLDHRPARRSTAPTALALARGIPVVAYNADGGKANKRLAYIGQDLYQSGLELGARHRRRSSGAATSSSSSRRRGQQNIQPRIDGALDAIRDSGRPITAHVVASGVDVGRRAHEDRGDVPGEPRAPRPVRGRRRLDRRASPTVMRKHGLHARRRARRRLRPAAGDAAGDPRPASSTSRSTSSRICRASCRCSSSSSTATASGLVAPADTNTGLNFVTRANVAPVPDDEEPLRGQLEPASSTRSPRPALELFP